MVPTCYNEPARARVTNLQRICQPRELPPGSELLDFLPEILTLACKATGPGTAGSWDSSAWAVGRGDPQAVKQGFLLSESGPHHSLHVREQLFSLRVSGENSSCPGKLIGKMWCAVPLRAVDCY